MTRESFDFHDDFFEILEPPESNSLVYSLVDNEPRSDRRALSHVSVAFATGYPTANGVREPLPGIINGFGASSNFLSVKQLAITNSRSYADRLAFFFSLATRFEVVTTSQPRRRRYSVFLDIMIEYKL